MILPAAVVPIRFKKAALCLQAARDLEAATVVYSASAK